MLLPAQYDTILHCRALETGIAKKNI